MYPISYYLSYESLSPKHHAFGTNLDIKEIINNIYEAFKKPE